MTSTPTPRRAAGVAPILGPPPGTAAPRGRTGQVSSPSAPVLGGLTTHSSQSPRVPRSAPTGIPDPAAAARDLRGVSAAGRVRRVAAQTSPQPFRFQPDAGKSAPVTGAASSSRAAPGRGRAPTSAESTPEGTSVLSAGQAAIAAAMSEAELLSNITLGTRKRPGMCERYGLTWYHTHTSKFSVSGFPDLVVVGRWVKYIELKRQGENPTKAQRGWIAALEAAGADVDVWRPSDWLSGKVQRELAALAGLRGAA